MKRQVPSFTHALTQMTQSRQGHSGLVYLLWKSEKTFSPSDVLVRLNTNTTCKLNKTKTKLKMNKTLLCIAILFSANKRLPSCIAFSNCTTTKMTVR